MAAFPEDQLAFIDQRIAAGNRTITKVTTSTPFAYPSTFFADNPGKPEVEIYVYDAAESYHRIHQMRNAHGWNDKLVCTFMWRVIAESGPMFTSSPLTEDWSSFGREIGGVDDEVSPLDILSGNELPRAEGDAIPQLRASELVDRQNTFFSILVNYRKAVARSQSDDYYGLIMDKLHTFFHTAQYAVPAEELTNWGEYSTDDNLTVGFKRIVCAIDMFFSKFPNHRYASMRMATLPTRYRGCISLVAAGGIADATGLSIRDLCHFIYTDSLQKDLAKILVPGNEINQLDGYFPYHLDMGTVTKSAYSLSANPTLVLWLHVIGCSLGIERSKNAIMPTNACDIGSTYINALIVGLHVGTGGGLQLRIARGVEEAQAIMIARKEREYQEEHDADEVSDVEGDFEEGEYEEAHRQAVERYNTRERMRLQKRENLDAHEAETGIARATRALGDYTTYGGFTEMQMRAITTMANGMRGSKQGTVGLHFYQRFGRAR